MRNQSQKSVKALTKAIKLAGGQTALANKINKAIEALGLTDVPRVEQQHIYNWLNRDKRVPTEYGHPIEHALGSAITRFQLCPGRLVKIEPAAETLASPA